MKRLLILCLALLAAFCAVPSAQAYLGGFENADGYVTAYTGYYNPPTFDNWVDVTAYNAGQWGANAGGGPLPVEMPLNSGLWTLTSASGAFYPNATLRNTYLGAGPPYPATTPLTLPQVVNSVAAYAIGNHFGGRFGTTALALRNATSYGPITYDYRLDSYDFGGIAPATVTSGTIGAGMYFQANPADSITDSRGLSPEKFIMSITDSTGSVGFQWAYLRDNSVEWRQGNTGAWNSTALIADDGSGIGNYDGVSFTLNLTSQTFKLDYYDVSTSTTVNLAPAGTALGNPMADFTHIGWYLLDNVYSGVGGKNFFDDFSFSVPVPEPASLVLLGAGGLLLLRRRRLS